MHAAGTWRRSVDMAREAYKGAWGVGVLAWAAYGTVATCAFGRHPTWDAHLSMGLGMLIGGAAGALTVVPRRASSRP